MRLFHVLLLTAAVPLIHIIVNNRSITLEGVVANEGHKDIAGIQANSVPGAFKTANNLRVESESDTRSRSK